VAVSSVITANATKRVSFPSIRIERLKANADLPTTVKAYNDLVRAIETLLPLIPQEYVEFEDVPVTVGVTYKFRHGFGGRVRWWVVGSSTAVVGMIYDSAGSDDNTISLTADAIGTVTIRVTPRGA
jgi:hypothetical protein